MLRHPSLRTATVGLLGGSIVATGTVAAADAPRAEPAYGPPPVADRPHDAVAAIGTYEACNAYFGLDKTDLTPFGITVQAGTGEVPDPLPVVPDDLVPVLTVEFSDADPVECNPDQAWTDVASFAGFYDMAWLLDDPTLWATYPGANYYLAPTTYGTVTSVTLRMEHVLPDGVEVVTAPTVLTGFENADDVWNQLDDDLFTAAGSAERIAAMALVSGPVRDAGYTTEADFLDDWAASGCDVDDDAAAAAAIAAIRAVFGITEEFPLTCAWTGEYATIALYGVAVDQVLPDNQVVVTVNGPAPTTTTTTTTTVAPTTVAPTTVAPTTTIDDGSGGAVPTTVAPTLPETGDSSGRAAILAGLLVALGLAGVAASRRREQPSDG